MQSTHSKEIAAAYSRLSQRVEELKAKEKQLRETIRTQSREMAEKKSASVDEYNVRAPFSSYSSIFRRLSPHHPLLIDRRRLRGYAARSPC